MTRDEQQDEWLICHRELQELRAAARTTPRRKLSASERDSRKRYAAHRWHKTQAAKRRRANRG